MKWVKSPAISANDCSMIEICTKIIGMLCLNEELCWQMIDSFSIITHLENGSKSFVLCMLIIFNKCI